MSEYTSLLRDYEWRGDEIDYLRAELAELRASRRWEYIEALEDRAEKAEAAIARVWAVLADPPVPSRMLIPVIRAAIEGEL